MPRGDKSAYTDKQKRQAEHIEEGYEHRGVPEGEAERRAWATVNKETGGGKKSGSGRGKPKNTAPSRKGGKLGGKARPHVLPRRVRGSKRDGAPDLTRPVGRHPVRPPRSAIAGPRPAAAAPEREPAGNRGGTAGNEASPSDRRRQRSIVAAMSVTGAITC